MAFTVSLFAAYAFTVLAWFVVAPRSFGKHLAKVASAYRAALEAKP